MRAVAASHILGGVAESFLIFVCVDLLGELGKKIPQADFWMRRLTCEKPAMKF